MLLERECADGLLQSETVASTSSMSKVLSVFAVIGEGAEWRDAMCASGWCNAL